MIYDEFFTHDKYYTLCTHHGLVHIDGTHVHTTEGTVDHGLDDTYVHTAYGTLVHNKYLDGTLAHTSYFTHMHCVCDTIMYTSDVT